MMVFFRRENHMLSKRWSVPVGIVIATLTWSSATRAEELLPPSGDVWMTSETPRYARERAPAYEVTILLGDVWLELQGRENAIAKLPQRETTGSGAEGRR